MSYGRKPYYIYAGGDAVHFIGKDVDAVIPYEAMAQFIGSMITRGDEEVEEWLELAKQVRPDIPKDLKVKVTGDGWGRSNS